MTATIRISQNLQKELAKYKISEKETYEDIIWNLLEYRMALSARTKKDIAQARCDIAQGKHVTLEQAKAQFKR